MDNKQKSHDEQRHKKGIDKVAFSELNIISAYNNIEQEREWNVGFVSYLNFLLNFDDYQQEVLLRYRLKIFRPHVLSDQ